MVGVGGDGAAEFLGEPSEEREAAQRFDGKPEIGERRPADSGAVEGQSPAEDLGCHASNVA